MGQWSREELESAFEDHKQVVVGIGKTWDWSRFADQFTEDATYVEHSFGTFHGREAIRDWIVAQMSVFPGSEMPFYPTTWHSIDTDRGWVLCEFRNRMRDPGDGSIHEQPNLSVQVRGRRVVELRGRRLQPDELPADGAGLPGLVQEPGHAVRRRRAIRPQHEMGTGLIGHAGRASRPQRHRTPPGSCDDARAEAVGDLPASAVCRPPTRQLSVHRALLDPRTTSNGSRQEGLVSEKITGGASRRSSP
jgi:hypothetical protein